MAFCLVRRDSGALLAERLGRGQATDAASSFITQEPGWSIEVKMNRSVLLQQWEDMPNGMQQSVRDLIGAAQFLRRSNPENDKESCERVI